MSKKLLLIAALLSSVELIAMDTAIVYNNGIRNSLADARIGQHAAFELYTASVAQDPDETITSHIAYNPSFGFANDLRESAVQLARQRGIPFSSVFMVLDGELEESDTDSPEFIELEATLIEQLNEDTDKFEALYRELVDQQKRVIIFAHSQGNFFANNSYLALPDAYEPYVGIIGVATPAGFVADGRGIHVKDCNDFINGAPDSLSCTTTNTESSVFGLNHSFESYYLLPGSNTEEQLGNSAILMSALVPFPPEVIQTEIEVFYLYGPDLLRLSPDDTLDEDDFSLALLTSLFGVGGDTRLPFPITACRVGEQWIEKTYSEVSTRSTPTEDILCGSGVSERAESIEFALAADGTATFTGHNTTTILTFAGGECRNATLEANSETSIDLNRNYTFPIDIDETVTDVGATVVGPSTLIVDSEATASESGLLASTTSLQSTVLDIDTRREIAPSDNLVVDAFGRSRTGSVDFSTTLPAGSSIPAECTSEQNFYCAWTYQDGFLDPDCDPFLRSF